MFHSVGSYVPFAQAKGMVLKHIGVVCQTFTWIIDHIRQIDWQLGWVCYALIFLVKVQIVSSSPEERKGQRIFFNSSISIKFSN